MTSRKYVSTSNVTRVWT